MSKENSGAVLSASVVTPTSPLVINEIDFNGHYGVKVLVNTPTVIGALRDSHSGLFLPVNKVLSDAIITAEIGNISISPTLTGEVGGEGVAGE
ncbi:MAG: hypothetical protein J0L79_02540 [Rickettsiales bacterium]|nr:hypothetical protein [Rickettsiales bacterium]MCA0254440.1 hypothetical protein [Pseudomonadota bacterium]